MYLLYGNNLLKEVAFFFNCTEWHICNWYRAEKYLSIDTEDSVRYRTT